MIRKALLVSRRLRLAGIAIGAALGIVALAAQQATTNPQAAINAAHRNTRP
jgi:hypothetical protein